MNFYYYIPITEIGTMPTSSNASGNSRFFNSFTNHNTIFFELFGQNCIEKGITTTVQRENKYGKNFSLF